MGIMSEKLQELSPIYTPWRSNSCMNESYIFYHLFPPWNLTFLVLHAILESSTFVCNFCTRWPNNFSMAFENKVVNTYLEKRDEHLVVFKSGPNRSNGAF